MKLNLKNLLRDDCLRDPSNLLTCLTRGRVLKLGITDIEYYFKNKLSQKLVRFLFTFLIIFFMPTTSTTNHL